MPKIRINQFNGGLDEDVRSHNTTTFKDVKGFDTLTYKHRLTPYGEAESEALSSGSIADKLITDVVRDSSGFIAFMGRSSSGSPNTADIMLKTSGTNVASAIESEYVDSVAAYLPNSFVFYRGSYYYTLSNGSGAVRRSVSGTWVTTTSGNINYTSAWSGMPVPKPVVHPADDILYGALGYALYKIDNTTFTPITSSPKAGSVCVPDSQIITSLTPFDSDLAIGTAPFYEGGARSTVYIWSRDVGNTVFRSSIDWGDDSLLILENLGGTLIGVSISDTSYAATSSYDLTKNKKVTVRVLSGGQAVVIKEIVVPSNFELKNYKAKTIDRFYFKLILVSIFERIPR